MSPVAWRRARAALLLAVALAYLPSLDGGFVWDDHYQVEANPLLAQPALLVQRDIRGALAGSSSQVYRPLAMLLHAALQAAWPGPLSERLCSLGLHLLAVLAVLGLAGGRGAGRAALLAAALFGLHPGASEAVAWISGRHFLLPSLLVLGGWMAWERGLALAGGALLALAPFASEAFLPVPLAALLLALGRRRREAGFLLPPLLGALLYLAVRRTAGLPLPAGAALSDPLGGLGGLGLRGLQLLFLPATADALPPLHPQPVLGGLLLAGGLLLLLAVPGRPALAGLAAAGVLLAPAAPAVSQLGLVGDRYFYLPLAAGAVALGRGLARLPAPPRAAFLLPGLLGLFTAWRARDWRSDTALFRASLALHPDSPAAAFHLGHALQVYGGDCEAAIPLYRRALEADPRAGNDLQACLLVLGRWEEAAELGPELARRSPASPVPAANTARALAALGHLDEALGWAREAARRAPSQVRYSLLLGELLGRAGHYDEARRAFLRALQLEPGSEQAREDLALAERLLAEQRAGAGEGVPPAPGEAGP